MILYVPFNILPVSYINPPAPPPPASVSPPPPPPATTKISHSVSWGKFILYDFKNVIFKSLPNIPSLFIGSSIFK